MMNLARSAKRAAAAALALAMAMQPALACTGIMLSTKDNAIVHGRTLEFGIYVPTEVVLVPRGYSFTGKTPLGDGKTWKAKYAALGTIAFGDLAVVDGLNEKGLAVGTFYFPTFAEYAKTTAENQSRSMSMSDFSNWIVTNFATVDEVRDAVSAGEAVIAPTLLEGWPPEPQPFHYVVYDASGASIVIEPVGGELKIHDNPLGVMTNSPTFDWHMTNLRNFVALDPRNVPAITVNDQTFQQLGQGTGMLGLPGDFTPPSRFVRAAVFSATAIPSETAQEGVYQAFHILNNFDIPVGVTRSESDDKIHTDYTMLTAVRDPQALRYYWKTYDDQTIKMVDMKALDLDAADIIKVSTKSDQTIDDVTGAMK